MKRFVFFALMIFTLNSICTANVKGKDHNIHYREQYTYKGNVSPGELPKAIGIYLKKEYPGHTILISKRKKNGNYFVKIRFPGNKYRPYYRSLVFTNQGKVVKG